MLQLKEAVGKEMQTPPLQLVRKFCKRKEGSGKNSTDIWQLILLAFSQLSQASNVRPLHEKRKKRHVLIASLFAYSLFTSA